MKRGILPRTIGNLFVVPDHIACYANKVISTSTRIRKAKGGQTHGNYLKTQRSVGTILLPHKHMFVEQFIPSPDAATVLSQVTRRKQSLPTSIALSCFTEVVYFRS
jgi:hypothetical protein